MSFDLDQTLRRLKPEKRSRRIAPRDAAALLAKNPPRQPVVPDATVYIHAGQGKLPGHVGAMVRDWPQRHCSVALGEIAYAIGRLEPGDPRTPARRAFFEDVVRRVPSHKVVTPDHATHVQAGILLGVLSRLQSLPAGSHRRHLNDLLILLAARRVGAAVLTANIGDFDLLQQLVPDAGVIFYRAAQA